MKINIAEQLTHIDAYWSPRIAGAINDMHIKLVKIKGEFIWHHHDHEDELFLVVKGRLLMQFRNREEWIEEGEFIIVPHGVEHRPIAPEETHIILLEPNTTLNTGNITNERTVEAAWLEASL